jgi:hypothetical protein
MRPILKPALILCAALSTGAARAQVPEDYNDKIIETVEWLAKHKAGLGYDLGSRFTEDLSYGAQTFPAKGAPKTMCVAAVFEIIVRSLQSAKDEHGQPVSDKLLSAKTLFGSSALHIAPYVFQYEANVPFPEYRRPYSAGVGDAFVLFGMGRYVTLETAKPGDFIYFNRPKGGHAVVFLSHLDERGKPAREASAHSGFRYFSAQKDGTNGMGYRDAYFGACPAVATTYRKDCNIIRSQSRKMFSVSRLYAPKDWFTEFSAIRVQRFFKGDSIDAIFGDEAQFRKRARTELQEANKKATAFARKGLFPLIVPPIAGESANAKRALETVEFEDEKFGPKFGE